MLAEPAGLDEVPETAFYVVAFPMRIGGGSGGPTTRIVAILDFAK